MAAHKFDSIVLRANPGLTSCEDLATALVAMTLEKLQYNNLCILVIDVQVFPQQVNYQSVWLISHAQDHDQDLISQAIVVLIYIIYCITGKFGGNIVWWKRMNNNFGENKLGE